MPEAVINKHVKEGKGSKKTLEKKWKKAKTIARKEGKEDYYSYIMGIYTNMVDDKKSSLIASSRTLNAIGTVLLTD